MMQVDQYSMPQFTDVSALHLLFFCAQSSTIFYIQFVEVLHLNLDMLHLSWGYVMKEILSFTKHHNVAMVLQHNNWNQIILQNLNIHGIFQGERRTKIPLKSNNNNVGRAIPSIISLFDVHLEVLVLQVTE